MSDEHPNVSLLKRFDPNNPTKADDLFAEDFVWHFFNPELPNVEGDYEGFEGLQTFFETIGAHTGATFKVEPLSATAFGNELVVAHTRNTMTIQGRPVALDAVVVWRIVDGRLAEAWDIPSVNTAAAE